MQHHKYNVIKNTPLLIKLFYLYAFFMAINFFLTPNPYSAYHSGHAGLHGNVISNSFYISPAYCLIMACIITTILNPRKLRVDLITIPTIAFMILSGLMNGWLYEAPQTYAYDTIILLLCSHLAISDSKQRYKDLWVKPFFICIYVLMIAGVVLSFFRPEIYGHFGDFTRTTRGEVTFWKALCIYPFFAPIALYGIAKTSNKITKLLWAVPFLGQLFVLFSTYMRAGVLCYSFLLAIYYHFESKKYRWIFISILILGVILTSRYIMNYFFLGNHFGDLLDNEPRIILWHGHICVFFAHPIEGVGRLVEPFLARSEIGILRWFSMNGLFFALCMCIIVFRGVWFAWQTMKKQLTRKSNIDPFAFFCCCIVFQALLVNIFNGYTRLLSLDVFMYFYSLLYLYYNFPTIKFKKASVPITVWRNNKKASRVLHSMRVEPTEPTSFQ